MKQLEENRSRWSRGRDEKTEAITGNKNDSITHYVIFRGEKFCANKERDRAKKRCDKKVFSYTRRFQVN